MHARSIVLAGLGSFAFAGCYASETHEAAASASDTPRVAEQVGPAFEAELLRIASAYRGWTRVSNKPARAPSDCRPPPTNGVLESESDDASTHGSKLYFLYAKDPDTYRAAGSFEFLDDAGRATLEHKLVGQALVKESWHQAAVDTAEFPPLNPSNDDPGKAPVVYADQGKYLYRTGEQADLFVMFKLDPASPGTDQGWVYGTVTADGRRVTSSGRVASCMRCHDESTSDRLLVVPHWRKERLTEQQIELLRHEDQTVDR